MDITVYTRCLYTMFIYDGIHIHDIYIYDVYIYIDIWRRLLKYPGRMDTLWIEPFPWRFHLGEMVAS